MLLLQLLLLSYVLLLLSISSAFAIAAASFFRFRLCNLFICFCLLYLQICQCFYQHPASAMSMDKISNAVPLSNPLSRTVLEIRSGFSKTLLWSCAEPTVCNNAFSNSSNNCFFQHHLLIYLDLPLPLLLPLL